MSDLQDFLDNAADLSSKIGGALPGPAGVVARIMSAALSAGAAIANAGRDPEVEITRILSADPLVAQVHADWDAKIKVNFPRDDPYEE